MRPSPIALALIAWTMLAAPAPAPATTTYRILYGGSDMSQSTPLLREEVWPLNPGQGATASFTGRGFAYPGHVGLFDRMDIDWTGGGGAYLECTLIAETNEFVISGPAGPPVPGSLHFNYRAGFARAAGYPGNNSHGGGTQIYAIANTYFVTGDYWVGNLGTSTASGIFTGLSGNSIDQSFSVTGMFPVGIPFSVRLQLFARAGVYGDISTGNPGFSEITAGTPGGGPAPGGLRLEEVSGQVMTLPAGYTVDCPTWGVVNNRYQPLVAVEPTPSRPDPALALRPNPARADVSVELAMPEAGEARVEVFDAAGRRLRTLATGRLPAGIHSLRWDGLDTGGHAAPAGVYFVRAGMGERVLLRRLVRLQ